jgi:hypothetical protein
MQLPRGAPKMQILGDGNKVSQMPYLHPNYLCCRVSSQ